MRRRDPGRLLERRRRARARVSLVPLTQAGCPPHGGIGSKQAARVTLPREELERIWTPENLERLARTYWHFLSRISLGVLRVLYTDRSREVVVLTRPLVLLRFKPPEYELDADGGTVTWRIDRGLLVAPSGRGRGYLRLSVRRQPASEGAGELSAIVSSEVVNFYPTIAGFSRIGRFLYNQTQLRLHVIVTNAFLRSLANLELQPSLIGKLASPADRPRSPVASPGRGER